MNTDQIFDTLQKIAEVTPTEKVKILKDSLQDSEFERVVVAALDPTITYGIDKLPEEAIPGESGIFTEEMWNALTAMKERTLTGGAAQQAIIAMSGKLSQRSLSVLTYILKKDLRAGIGSATVNKAKKGLIPEFPYMRCCLPKHTDLSKFSWNPGVIAQEKADAMFANVIHEHGGIVRILSRQGSSFPLDQFGTLVNAIRLYLGVGTWTHGEMMVQRSGVILSRAEANGILNSILDGGSFAENEEPIFYVWDQIPAECAVPGGKYDVPYAARLKAVRDQVMNDRTGHLKLIETKIVKSFAEAKAYFKSKLKEGKEGLILKDPKAIWEDKTSKYQVKLKLEFEVELRVIGFEPGEGKNAATFGSLICQSEDGKLVVSISGFKDALRLEIHENREDWINSVVTARANDILEPGKSSPVHSLFLPRFIERRNDKSEADSLERIYEIREAAIDAAETADLQRAA